VVAVRCDSREDLNIPPYGGQMDFLTYGGICRAVCLDVKEPAYLRDVFIETKAEGGFRIYTATVGETVGCTLQAEIRSPSGSRAFYTGELSLPITGALNSVHPWSIEHPTLYTLTVRLIRPGTGGLPDRVLDEKSCRFGFRTLQFVAGGLYLNGQRVELRGLNRRQSYAYQGYAMPDSIQRLDAQLLKKQLGCNAVLPAGHLHKDQKAQLVASIEEGFRWRVVRGAHGVESGLFHQPCLTPFCIAVRGGTERTVVMMEASAVHFYGLTVQN
jgi:beta-galactosidase